MIVQPYHTYESKQERQAWGQPFYALRLARDGLPDEQMIRQVCMGKEWRLWRGEGYW